MSGRKPPIANVEPRLGGVRIQTSLYGQTIPVVLGKHRISGNLLWFDNFKTERQEERSEAGKGGGRPAGRMYYTYSASVAMLLAEGPVLRVSKVWRAKSKFEGQEGSTSNTTPSHAATVPLSAPYTITVPNASQWTGNVRVVVPDTDPYDFPPYDFTLQEGVDYTVAGGVYTFPSIRAGLSVIIDYTAVSVTPSLEALAQLGLALTPGRVGQASWQYLVNNYPDAALPYSGLAYVRGQDYPLSNSAEVENHNFEVVGPLSTQTNEDASPADIILELASNTQWGAEISSGLFGDMTLLRSYCQAFGLNFSLAATEQRPLRDWIADLLEACNTDACWNGSVLKFIPRGEEARGGYSPNFTPVYDLSTDAHLQKLTIVERRASSEVANTAIIEFMDRARNYDVMPETYVNEAALMAHGVRPPLSRVFHFITERTVASAVALLLLQYETSVRMKLSGELPIHFSRLELGDLVTLTDTRLLKLDRLPVRITQIRDSNNGFLSLEFEEFPIGHATAPIVQVPAGVGFNFDFNASPGNVVAPGFFEPPGAYTPSGLEVWAAVSGPAGDAGKMWGGAEVYCSLDGGTSYKLAGRVDQGARFGALTALMGIADDATLEVQLAGRGGRLRSVSAPEANAHTTLAFVGDTASGEWLAFELATLTGTNAYTLGGLRRGLYGTEVASRAAGTAFVYIDGAVARSGPLPEEMIGREIKFKFCSFNVFGGGLQTIESVPEYSYTLTGRFRDTAPPPLSANLVPGSTFSDAVPPQGWSVTDFGMPAGTAYLHRHIDPSYVVQGSVRSLILSVPTDDAGDDRAAVFWSPFFPAHELETYIAFVDLVPWGTNGRIALEWWSGATHMTTVEGNVVEGVPVESIDRRMNNPAHYRRSRIRQEAPAGVTHGRAAIVARGGWVANGAGKHLSVWRPFFGEVPPGSTADPVWSPGPNGPVSHAQLVPGATGGMTPKQFSDVLLPTNRCDTPLAASTFAEVKAQIGDTIDYEFSGTVSASAGTRVRFGLIPTLFTDQLGQPTRNSRWKELPGPFTDFPFSIRGAFVVTQKAIDDDYPHGLALYASVSSVGTATIHAPQLIVQLRRP